MKEIKGRLFVRSEDASEYRNWDDLAENEKRTISELLNRQAAYASGFVENMENLKEERLH